MEASTALLVIDMQVALVTGAHEGASVLDNINQVISKARQADVSVIFVVHNHSSFEPMMKGAAGWTVHPNLDHQPDDPVVEKTASDAFYRTNLEALLQAMSVDTLLVTGMQTEYCVDTTCRAALSHGFDVTLVADAHTTGPELLSATEIIAHHNALLANLAHPDHGIRVVPAAEINLN